MPRRVFVLAVVSVLSGVIDVVGRQPEAAGGSDRTLPARSGAGDLVVMVAEGPHEPHSIGSYALRLYAPGDDPMQYDRFVGGVVRPRDGSVERVVFADVDGGGEDDLVVITRSAGSGGYLAADVFVVTGAGLRFVRAVEGLSSDADPLAVLSTRECG